MSARLFVGNLPYDTTESDLREFFSPIGTLSAVIIPMDRETGKPRGFAFVEFADKARAEEAGRRLNNQSFKGRNITINEARAKENRRDTGSGIKSSHPMRAAGTGRMYRSAAAAKPSLSAPDFSTYPLEADRNARAERRSRNLGPDSRTSRKRKSNYSGKNESGWKKGPIRERVGGQFFGSYKDDLYEDGRELDYMDGLRNTDEEDAV